MKVFLSWSGDISLSVAEALREWLPNVIQRVEPWLSSEDIDKGTRWSSDIGNQLSEAQAGIICITKKNMYAPWILFEAGALSKTIENAFVCPYLFGLKPTDLEGPLVQFQATSAEKEDTRRLIQTINRALKNEALPNSNLDKAFNIWWPELEKDLSKLAIPEPQPVRKSAQKPIRPERDVLDEILSLVRSLVRDSRSREERLTNESLLKLSEYLGEDSRDQFSYPKYKEQLAEIRRESLRSKPALSKLLEDSNIIPMGYNYIIKSTDSVNSDPDSKTKSEK